VPLQEEGERDVVLDCRRALSHLLVWLLRRFGDAAAARAAAAARLQLQYCGLRWGKCRPDLPWWQLREL